MANQPKREPCIKKIDDLVLVEHLEFIVEFMVDLSKVSLLIDRLIQLGKKQFMASVWIKQYKPSLLNL